MLKVKVPDWDWCHNGPQSTLYSSQESADRAFNEMIQAEQTRREDADSDMTISVKLDIDTARRMYRVTIREGITVAERLLLIEVLQEILDSVKENAETL